MKYFLDTEFNEDGRTIELISLALVREDGEAFYAESQEVVAGDCNQFVWDNVLPNLMLRPEDRRTKLEIREGIERFIGQDLYPEFWAYYGAYDWVAFCQLWGPMVALPDHFPRLCYDVKQLADSVGMGNTSLHEYMKPGEDPHNALSDALATMRMHDGIRRILAHEKSDRSLGWGVR